MKSATATASEALVFLRCPGTCLASWRRSWWARGGRARSKGRIARSTSPKMPATSTDATRCSKDVWFHPGVCPGGQLGKCSPGLDQGDRKSGQQSGGARTPRVAAIRIASQDLHGSWRHRQHAHRRSCILRSGAGRCGLCPAGSGPQTSASLQNLVLATALKRPPFSCTSGPCSSPSCIIRVRSSRPPGLHFLARTLGCVHVELRICEAVCTVHVCGCVVLYMWMHVIVRQCAPMKAQVCPQVHLNMVKVRHRLSSFRLKRPRFGRSRPRLGSKRPKFGRT